MTIASNRRFGVEIEFLGIGNTIEKVCKVFSENGIELLYGSPGGNSWGIHVDGSVLNGFEVVSPILSGEAGLATVRKVADFMKKNKALVDNRCGLHVHVDAQGLSGADLLRIVERYSNYEIGIDGFMQTQRRFNKNTFCRTVEVVQTFFNSNRAQFNPVDASSVADAMASYIGRYYKVNLCSYIRHGTVEFRHHHGSVDSEEICNWIKFCVGFVENSKVEILGEKEEYTSFQKMAFKKDPWIKKWIILANELNNTGRYDKLSAHFLSRKLDIPIEKVPDKIARFSRLFETKVYGNKQIGYYRKNYFNYNNLIANYLQIPGSTSENMSLLALSRTAYSTVTTKTPKENGLFEGIDSGVEKYFLEKCWNSIEPYFKEKKAFKKSIKTSSEATTSSIPEESIQNFLSRNLPVEI